MKNIEKNHKYEPPRHIVDFHVAGFAYYDGLDVFTRSTCHSYGRK